MRFLLMYDFHWFLTFRKWCFSPSSFCCLVGLPVQSGRERYWLSNPSWAVGESVVIFEDLDFRVPHSCAFNSSLSAEVLRTVTIGEALTRYEDGDVGPITCFLDSTAVAFGGHDNTGDESLLLSNGAFWAISSENSMHAPLVYLREQWTTFSSVLQLLYLQLLGKIAYSLLNWQGAHLRRFMKITIWS